MTQAIAIKPEPERLGAAIERVLIKGDLSGLSPDERTKYYAVVCESLGLNPLTKPFEYLRLNNKEVLYATRNATEQLRRLYRVSIVIVARERHEDVYVVTARATMPDGRSDESVGAVPIAGMKGESLANAFMKAETKAKRRVTLSMCGLGVLDETEVETIPGAQVVPMNPRPVLAPSPPHDPETGEVFEAAPLDTVASFTAEILAAKAEPELKAIAACIKASRLTDAEKAEVKKAYGKRLADLGVPPKDDTAQLRDAFLREVDTAESEHACGQIIQRAAERVEAGELSGESMKRITAAAKAKSEALRSHYIHHGEGRGES